MDDDVHHRHDPDDLTPENRDRMLRELRDVRRNRDAPAFGPQPVRRPPSVAWVIVVLGVWSSVAAIAAAW